MHIPLETVTKKGRIINHLVDIFRDFLKPPSQIIARFDPPTNTKIIYMSQKQDDIYFVIIPRKVFEGARVCGNEEDIREYLQDQELIRKPIKYGLGKTAVKKLLSETNLDEWRVFWIPPNHNPFYCRIDERAPIIFHPEELGYSRCLNCLTEFYLPNPFRLYCSPKCRRQAEFRRRKKKIIAPKKCTFCGNLISDLTRSHTKFCSVKCRVAHHRQQKKSLS